MERYHNFELVLYYKPTIFNSIIQEDKNILHYAYIFHDKDVKDDNVPTEPHYHLLINYKHAKTFNACLTQFTVPSYNSRVIPIIEKQKQDRFEYLYHFNNPEKFQYTQELIVTDNANFWTSVDNSNTEKTVNLINDLIEKKPLRELLETYGRDFVINYDRYRRFAIELCYREETENYSYCRTEPFREETEFLADNRTGEVVGVEDKSIQTDFLLNATKND